MSLNTNAENLLFTLRTGTIFFQLANSGRIGSGSSRLLINSLATVSVGFDGFFPQKNSIFSLESLLKVIALM